MGQLRRLWKRTGMVSHILLGKPNFQYCSEFGWDEHCCCGMLPPTPRPWLFPRVILKIWAGAGDPQHHKDPYLLKAIMVCTTPRSSFCYRWFVLYYRPVNIMLCSNCRQTQALPENPKVQLILYAERMVPKRTQIRVCEVERNCPAGNISKFK